MANHCVVFYGDFSAERIRWSELAAGNHWAVCRAKNLEHLTALKAESEIIAVYADYEVADLGKIRQCVPEAKLVICYPLRIILEPEELAALGAFHCIPRPLDQTELRQSFGFLWEAWSRPGKRSRRVKITAA